MNVCGDDFTARRYRNADTGHLGLGLDCLDPSGMHALHVANIGAGVSGMCAAISLQQAGIPFTIIEKTDTISGTGYENSCPGCGVDLKANAIMSAVGILNRPKLHDIPDRDSFAGPAVHTGH